MADKRAGYSENVKRAKEKNSEKEEYKTKKEVISHLKKDNKECNDENKMHNKLIKKMKKD